MNKELLPNPTQREFLLGILFLVAAFYLYQLFLTYGAIGWSKVAGATFPNLKGLAE